jgi:hypothetical protein
VAAALGGVAVSPLHEVFDLIAPTLREQLAWLRLAFPKALEEERVNAPSRPVDPLVEPYRASVMNDPYSAALVGYNAQMASRALRQADMNLQADLMRMQLGIEQDRCIKDEPLLNGSEPATEPRRRTEWTTAKGEYIKAQMSGRWVDEDGNVLRVVLPSDLPR